MTGRDVAERWLQELERHLTSMPEARRADIVSETRAHLIGRMGAGLSAEQALHGFGSAADYGRAFLDDFAIDRALRSRSTLGMVSTLVRVAGRALRALIALLVLSICTCLAIAVVLVIVSQATSVTPGRFEYAVTNVPADGTHAPQRTISFGATAAGDVRVLDLGFWVFPLALALLVALWLVARFGLLVAVRSLKVQDATCST